MLIRFTVRLILGAVVTIAWTKLKRVITKLYGSNVSLWFSLITLTQFHFIFYMSRPLPNIMALPIVLFALAYWLLGQLKPFIICSGIAILIFRSELIIFFGLLVLYDLIFRKTTINRILKIALPAGLVIMSTTILVDSFFWKRLLWPEGDVLWYNTILNKSSDWGTSPFLWYFYSALPRAMGASLLFVPLGLLLERRIRPIVLSALGFVLIYSILPHKELRFVIYVFPVFNLAAATACQRFWRSSSKSLWHRILALCAGGHLVANVIITLFLLMISGTNYPGGVALRNLHYLERQTVNVSLHISNLAAQSGISRFMQIRNDWRYCKKEYINYTKEDVKHYTHLLMETKNKFNTPLWSSLQQDFDTLMFIDCFNNIAIQYNSIIPVKIKTKPCLTILRRRQKSADVGTKVENNTSIEIVKNTEHQKQEKFALEITDNLKHYPKVNVSKYKAETPLDLLKFPSDGSSLIDETNASEETNDSNQTNKEINFQELHNLALGQVNRKTRATKLKIRRIIEQHYREKGKHVEHDSKEKKLSSYSTTSTRQSVKAIIKQERIREMIEQISTMDLTKMCNLEKVSTKDCLKLVIDKIDEDSINVTKN